MNKVLFLDIDGVLNYAFSKARCQGFIGIDSPKVALLKEIVDATDVKIVLTSTWKLDYEKYLNDGYQNKLGKYLREKLREKDLEIFDTTTRYETNLAHRGEGIYNYVKENNVDKFVILDDDIFPDYEEYNLMPYLVNSEWVGPNHTGGLNEDLVKQAIQILGEKSC